MPKKIILIIFLFFCAMQVHAQVTNIGNIQSLIQKTNTEAQVRQESNIKKALTTLQQEKKNKPGLYRGLKVADTGPCKGLFIDQQDSSQSAQTCSHGPDEFDPQENDALLTSTTSQTVVNSIPSLTSLSSLACDGDGQSGYRVQVIFLQDLNNPAIDFTNALPIINRAALITDSVYFTNAQAQGGYRRIRFVTDSKCQPIVQNIQAAVPVGSSIDPASAIKSILRNAGFTRSDRIYLTYTTFHHPQAYGQGSVYVPGLTPMGPHYAEIYWWGGWVADAAAHELGHNMGAVQMDAPHQDTTWHCTDRYDVMCTQPITNPIICPNGRVAGSVAGQYMNTLLDCNQDDYFKINPDPTSYLGTHWNVAQSPYLITSDPNAGGSTTQCPFRSRGDADCDNKITVKDFGIWSQEFLRLVTTMNANFDSNTSVDIADFNIWSSGYRDTSLAH